MAIVIPALVTSQFNTLMAQMRPVQDAITKTQSFSAVPHGYGNVIADLLGILVDLMDSGTLTATAGTATSVSDTGAFTGVNSLVNCTAVFNGNVTADLAGVSATVISNTVNDLNFAAGALPATPQVGDTFVVRWTAVDKDLLMLTQGKSLGSRCSNPFGPGPSLINAMLVVIEQLGGTPPAELSIAQALPFSAGNPHSGDGARGHGGLMLIAYLLEATKAQIAAWTVPT